MTPRLEAPSWWYALLLPLLIVALVLGVAVLTVWDWMRKVVASRL